MVLLLVLTLATTGSCKEEPKKKDTPTKTSTSVTPGPANNKTSETKGEIALNPAHGQPGHRCDIPVGAPLNSVPATTTNNAESGSPVINSGEVKLNPAHGQPGHRCDIKVGDPL